MPEEITKTISLAGRWEEIAAGIAAVVAGFGGGIAWLKKRPAAPAAAEPSVVATLQRIEFSLVSIGERTLRVDELLSEGEPSLAEKMDRVYLWLGEPGQDQTTVSRLTSQSLALREIRDVVGQLAGVATQLASLVSANAGQNQDVLKEIRDALLRDRKGA
jgi:hypothetical protein